MLTEARSKLREWALFSALALTPAAALSVVSIRALHNEEVAVRREAARALDASADRLTVEIDRETEEATVRLGAATMGDGSAAVTAAMRGITPTFAQTVLLDASRAVLLPPPPSAVSSPLIEVPASCALDARTLASSRDAALRSAARKQILARCREARTESERFLWPMVALDRASEVPADDVLSWVEQHESLLGGAEREATRADLVRYDAATRARFERVLSEPGGTAQLVNALLREEPVGAALREASASTAVARFRAPTSLGRFRRLTDGRYVGFVVHAATLGAWLDAGGPALAAGVHAAVSVGTPRDEIPTRATSDRPLHAVVQVAPALRIKLTPEDAQAVARDARRGRRGLIVVAVSGTILAFALAALLFARMRAARRSSELRTDFVSTVSHELRTPVASLRMLAELLEQDRVEPGDRAEVHQALSREARRMGETIDRLLGFGRMAAGRYTVTREDTAIDSSVGAAIDDFEKRFPDEPKVERALTTIRGNVDAGQIRLAIDNLIMNAHKYAPKGTPYRVALEKRDGGIAISVTDRGPGIAPRDRKRIWRAFERGDARLSRATEGTGIGLSLVSHVARAHGGRAWVESELGVGSTFILWIPGSAT